MKMLSFVPNHRMRTFLAILVITALLLANVTVLSHAATNTLSTNVISTISAVDSATMLLASMGVISADSSGTYNLNKSVTRAEFAKMLVMASSYKDVVTTTSKSSPFRDVASSNWAAPYIKIAASKGLLSGYSDGTFRPNNTITLEQGVNSVLKLLGYTQSDFTGAFPYAQMNVYSSNGLSDNIVGGVGTLMTKGDAANLLYNLMGTTMKDGTQKYAETLGYTLNDSGEVDYAGVISANMNGPYTVKSSNWASELGMSASSLTIYKNGSTVTASDIENYDILYYSQSKGTVWVYDDRVTGVYEKASPSQNAVTSVTVSGTEYQVESSAAFAALSSTGNLKIGSAVTLLLGKNGGVADAVAGAVSNEASVIYVTETGTKSYENSNGSQYSSRYIRGIRPNGNEIEYAISQDWIEVGDMVKISFDSDGDMSINSTSSGGKVYGKVDSDLYTIGTASIATTANIVDTNLGNYAATSMARLNGVTIDSSDVLYYEASGGKVTTLFLDDVTGDTAQYGIVISAKSAASGTYTYMSNGVSATLSGASSINAHGGGAKFYGESGNINLIKNLYSTGLRVTSFTSSQVIVNDDIGTYPVSTDVDVYSYINGVYKASTLSDALSAYQSKKAMTFYYDKDPDKGGCVRVIVYQ